MHYIITVFIFLLLFNLPVIALTENIDIENLFKKELADDVIYSSVPRGLIISIDENTLFDGCDTEIKPESLHILNRISEILKKIKNYCVIENHTQDICTNELEEWEISMIRAGNIVDYMIKNNSVRPEQIFDIGYGENMPLNEGINQKAKAFNNRVDFVILNYETSR